MKSHSFFKLGITLLTFLYLQVALSYTLTDQNSFLNKIEELQNPHFISIPELDHQPLINAFNRAKKSIHLGIFGISNPEITNALINASARGVEVTVLCDKYCYSNNKKLENYNKLRQAGIYIFTTSSKFSISHWKTFIIDKELAFISTMNFIERNQVMRDFGVFITNQSIINEMLKVMNSDIENSIFNTKKTPDLKHPNLVWSPINSEFKISELIKSATNSIEIYIENIGSPTIHQALKDAANKGVHVRLLASLCGMGKSRRRSFEKLDDLAKNKILVHVMPSSISPETPYIHAKSITVDRQLVYLGSENYSDNSLLKSRELGIIFKNEDVEKQLNRIFEQDFNKSVQLPETDPGICKFDQVTTK